MAPKRKTQIPPKDAKLIKKSCKVKMDDSSFGKDNNSTGKINKGKNNVVDNEEKKDRPCVKFEYFSPDLLDENQGKKNVDQPNIHLNQLLQKKARNSTQGAIRWKTFQFPSIRTIAPVPPKTQQYFGLDLVDGEMERTVWTHKPSVWQDLFETVFEVAANGQGVAIDDMFKGILACPVQEFPNGRNDIESFKTQKGQIIQHWIMLVPMPVDIDSSRYIPEFISKFQALCTKPFIRSAYKSGVIAITHHHGLMTQILEDGNYWIGIDNAVQKEIFCASNTCLSEVLMDCTIKEIVSLMFGVNKNPAIWTNSVKTYAFGN
jgi:hypothetical protein